MIHTIITNFDMAQMLMALQTIKKPSPRVRDVVEGMQTHTLSPMVRPMTERSKPESERAAFEEWLAVNVGAAPWLFKRDADDNYDVSYVQSSWDGWQGRAAHAQPSPDVASLIEHCANIALAIDSGRGNEKEIAKAIRALAATNSAPAATGSQNNAESGPSVTTPTAGAGTGARRPEGCTFPECDCQPAEVGILQACKFYKAATIAQRSSAAATEA